MLSAYKHLWEKWLKTSDHFSHGVKSHNTRYVTTSQEVADMECQQLIMVSERIMGL